MSKQNLTKEELKHYIKKHKEHEANKTSTNKRNKYWKEYFIPTRTETSFNMNNFWYKIRK